MKRLLTLSILASVCFAARLSAQTFYEVTFEHEGTEIVGLMKYNDVSDCDMRFVTAKSIEENMVFPAKYRNYTEGKNSADDINMMIYYPVKEDGSEELDKDNPAFVWFWEKDDASDMTDKPYFTFDIEDQKTYQPVTYFRQISVSDMNEGYVGQFYGTEEPEYAMLINAIRQQTNATDAAQAPAASGQGAADGACSLHLIVVANTDVSDIGASCKKDMDNLNSEFQGISHVLGMNFQPHYIYGNTYSKQNVQDFLGSFKPADNDVVVFMYTGHGWRYDDQEDVYPNIDLSPTSYDNPLDNYLCFRDVADVLFENNARLKIVLSDCCNAKIGVSLSMLNNSTLFARSNNNFDLEKLRRLFLDSNGTVIATSASPGEKSLCNINGGFFTTSFIESLRNDISVLYSGQPSWENIIDSTIRSAAKKTEELQGQATQNGIKQLKVTEVRR